MLDNEPVEFTIAARLLTWVVKLEIVPFIEARSELSPVISLISIGIVAYCEPPEPELPEPELPEPELPEPELPEPELPEPEPPDCVDDWRTWANVSGVALGGTCQISLQVTVPLLLL
jgi:hypothetical protein